MKIQIRRARPDDARKIRNAHVASVRILCAKDYNARQIAAWSSRKPDEYRRAMKTEAMYVAQAGERIAGFSAAHGREVRAVYVHPRFARRGVGAKLLAAAERAVRNA